MIRRAKEHHLGDNSVILTGPIGKRKLSEVIIEFAGPVFEDARDRNEAHGAIMLAMLAWNLGIAGRKASSLPKKDLLKACGGDRFSTGIAKGLIDMLVDRKHEFYADDDRFVLEHELTGGPGNWYLQVLYSPEPGTVPGDLLAS